MSRTLADCINQKFLQCKHQNSTLKPFFSINPNDLSATFSDMNNFTLKKFRFLDQCSSYYSIFTFSVVALLSLDNIALQLYAYIL